MRKAEATRTAEAEAARRLGCNDNEPSALVARLSPRVIIHERGPPRSDAFT